MSNKDFQNGFALGRASGGGNGGGDSSVQSDYLQNDQTAADYIKNRPFYSAVEFPKEVVPLQDIELTQSGDFEQLLEAYCVSMLKTPILVNRTYDIAFDGVSEKAVCKIFDMSDMGEDSLIPYFGNIGLIFGEDFDTGESYIIVFMGNDATVWYKSSDITEGIHTLSITYADTDYDMAVLIDDTYNIEIDSKDNEIESLDLMLCGYIPSANSRFKLTLNNNSYDIKITAVYDEKNDDYLYYAGNLNLYKDYKYEDSGEEFCLIVEYGYVSLYFAEEGEYTVYLALLPEETIHKIDSKYLDLSDIEEEFNDLHADVSSINGELASINEELANPTLQLVEGIVGDSKTRGLSANRNTIPTAEGAWIEGGAREIKVLQYNPTISIQEQTITLTFPSYIQDVYENTGRGDCLAIIFNSEPDRTYYFEVTDKTHENYQKVVITANHIINTDTFPADTSKILSIKRHKKIGKYSHTEGTASFASGESAHAEGVSTKAYDKGSHAEGVDTVATSEGSHAEGYDTKASGDYSHAEGYKTHAHGNYSHAEGEDTYADGNYSHAEGSSTYANGDYSHAEGYGTYASGDYSHAEGVHTIASGSYSHVQGKYNIEDTENKYAHIVGNGKSLYNRFNAHTLDWEGNAWYSGSVEAVQGLIVKSSTEGSTKRFKITVDDAGSLTATEIIEEEAITAE